MYLDLSWKIFDISLVFFKISQEGDQRHVV